MADLNQPFVASIAHALNSSGIPCVLWGHCLLGVHGIPSIVASIDFIIPDELLLRGIKTLKGIPDLRPCPDPATCLTGSPQRYTPPPSFHLHIDSSEVTVDLCLQSETLWFLPPLDGSLARPEADKLPSHFTLATDQNTLPPWRPGRGSGVYLITNQPIVVPKAHILLEAFLRIYARDCEKRVGSFGIAMIGYIEQYVDEDGLLDVDLLPEPLRTLYKGLHEGEKSVKQFERELKRALRMPDSEQDID